MDVTFNLKDLSWKIEHFAISQIFIVETQTEMQVEIKEMKYWNAVKYFDINAQRM